MLSFGAPHKEVDGAGISTEKRLFIDSFFYAVPKFPLTPLLLQVSHRQRQCPPYPLGSDKLSLFPESPGEILSLAGPGNLITASLSGSITLLIVCTPEEEPERPN